MWHINYLEMMVVFLAFEHLLPVIRNVVMWSSESTTSVVFYIKPLRGMYLCPVPLWTKNKLLLRANLGADLLLRFRLRPIE